MDRDIQMTIQIALLEQQRDLLRMLKNTNREVYCKVFRKQLEENAAAMKWINAQEVEQS